MTQLTPLDLDDLRCKAEVAFEELLRAEEVVSVALKNRIEAANAYVLAYRRFQAQQAIALASSPPGAMRPPTDMTT